MVFKGIIRLRPVTELYVGQWLIFDNSIVTLLNASGLVKFHSSQEERLLDDSEVLGLTSMFIEHESELIPSDLGEDSHVRISPSGKFSRFFPVVNFQWWEIISRGLVDQTDGVQFVSDALILPRDPILSQVAYIIFNEGGTFEEEEVRKVAWFFYESGINTGRAQPNVALRPERFNTNFEVTLSGFLDGYRNKHQQK